MSIVVQFQAHAIMDLIVSKSDVVLEDSVPLLNSDLLRPRTYTI